nr:hypothetical protein [Tanacetum cinerariifolium]
MVTHLTKSDASEGFDQVIDFLNGSYIKYALTVNPNIYVSCIKQFWITVAIKQVNDVTRLQALVDKKKVVVTEVEIREWKFLIHTILLSMSAKRTSWNEFSSAMASAIICLSTDVTAAQGDDAVALMDDKKEDKKDEEAKEDEPAEVQEVVDVVTIAKLITEVVTAASEIVTAASTIIFAAEPQVPASTIIAAPTKVAATPSRRRKGVVIRDPK